MLKYYIAYGSNLNLPQMAQRCPNAKPIGTAYINNYQLLFKGSERGYYLTIEPQENNKVPVAIWEINESDEIELDDYEGYPSLYYKKEMTLDMKNLHTNETSKQNAFVYIMHEHYQLGLPTDQYVQDCLEGYQSFNFDENYILHALQISKNYKENL